MTTLETPIFDSLYDEVDDTSRALVARAVTRDEDRIAAAIDSTLAMLRDVLDEGLPSCSVCEGESGDPLDVATCEVHDMCHDHCHDSDMADRAYDAKGDRVEVDR